MDSFFVSISVATTAETLAKECQSPVIAGRSDACELHLAHPLVSRRHASIERRDDGTFAVTDLGSRNGTIVDGDEINGSSVLARAGSIVQIGPFTLKLSEDAVNVEETVLAPKARVPRRVTVERDLRRVLVDGAPAIERLSPQEFQFLEMLAEASPAVVKTEQMGDKIWGKDLWDVHMLHNLVKRLRGKFKENGFPGEIVENIPGSGYRVV